MAPEKEGPPKKAAAEEDEDQDSVPIALSQSKLAKSREAPRKWGEEDDEDYRPILARCKAAKKKLGTPNGSGLAKVKKEEAEEGEQDDQRKPPKKEMISKKKEDGKGSAMPTKVKKEEPNGAGASEEEDDDDEKAVKKKKNKKMIKKKELENKRVVKKVSKPITEENGKKREKKVYDLPGQKHDPPEVRDPLRIFYETLYQQLPNSEMAQYWMMEYGLLPLEIAGKIHAKKLKKNPQSRLNSPLKAVSAKTTAVSVKKVVKLVPAGKAAAKTTAKRKIAGTSSDEDDDDDFISPKKKQKKQKV